LYREYGFETIHLRRNDAMTEKEQEKEISEVHSTAFKELQDKVEVYHEQIRQLRDEQEKLADHIAVVKATAHEELSQVSGKAAFSPEAMAVLRARCW
jgi:hypothetical protein